MASRHDPVGYTFEADIYCPDCTAERFPPCDDHEEIACSLCNPDEVDDEGNPIHAVFEWDESDYEEHCGSCGEIIPTTLIEYV